MDRRTDGRYQAHYLPASLNYAIDNYFQVSATPYNLLTDDSRIPDQEVITVHSNGSSMMNYKIVQVCLFSTYHLNTHKVNYIKPDNELKNYFALA